MKRTVRNGGRPEEPALGSREIAEVVPHRYPFLLVDRILERSPGRVVAVKNVTRNECYLNGHFPGMPIFPGCLLMEAMAQAGAFLGDDSTGEAPRVDEAFLLSSESKFLRPVGPGDRVILTVRLQSWAREIVRFQSEAFVEDVRVARARFMVLVRMADDSGDCDR
jgi:3-hydroxyacyl-[acyl-carrier-protein] dehydratase